MTESKKTLESEGTTARPKEKPYVPIENRPLLERLIPLLAELTPLPKRKKA